jgi:hypothetical protein
MLLKRYRHLALVAVLFLGGCGDASTGTEPGPFFPTKPEEDGASMTALYQGPLVVRDGCVLIGRPGDYSVPIWWEGFTAERDESGRVVVRDGDGAVVAIEGGDFEMGGGYVAEFRPEDRVDPREEQLRRVEEWLGYPIPERCLGSDVYGVWSVGETEAISS